MKLLVELITGDSWRGMYAGRDAEYLYIRDAHGKRRPIQLIKIADITDAEAGQFQACLNAE
jgi:hypothetical protein